ncbi:MAG: hypothetical protein AUH85_03540 [Chloroflexi bacterium 13_1_40CM_4_68_4]|nr:MAG: hypothetical protein AUH85_03540 [Chloroflexi bacterium 13_1_40CM_4_68_4]
MDEPVRARCAESPPAELLHAIEEFDRGQYFEQHETLETLWRATRTPVRDLYHGILQVGVGLHHLRRGNFHGASVLLEEGIARLRPFAPSCQRVDVDRLIRVIELGPEGLAQFDWSEAPRVRLLG